MQLLCYKIAICILKINFYKQEVAIKTITQKCKDFFENALAEELNLARVSEPLFVRPDTGLNDNLNGVESPVSFDVRGIGGHVS